MKKSLLACSLLAMSSFALAQDIDLIIHWEIEGNYDNHHPNNQGVACNRRGLKANEIQGNSVDTLSTKLSGQTDLLRKVLAREGYVHTPSGNIAIVELEARACKDVHFPLACKRAVNFEEKADSIKAKQSRYESELRQYQAAKSVFNPAEDARREQEAATARDEARTLSLRLDEKLVDLVELKLGVEAIGPMDTIEMREFKQQMLGQIEAREREERRQVAEAVDKADRLEGLSKDYRPASNREVVLAKRELVAQVQSTIDEYVLLKKIVAENESLARVFVEVPGNFPKNSYDNEMKCASNVFDELAEKVNRLPVE